MKIFKNFNIENKFKNSAIGIGNFDGFHLGHQRVLKIGKKIAKKNNAKFGLMVFHPLPVMYFNEKIKNFRIDSLKQKIESAKNYKIDFLIIKKFDKNFSNLSAENFIKKIIFKKLITKLFFIFKIFLFEKKISGNITLWKKKRKTI